MDGGGCWWKKGPWLRGQGEQGFQEGRGPRFWLLLGWQEEEEEERASGGWSAATPEPSQGTFGISPIVRDRQARPWRHRPASVRACLATPPTWAWSCRATEGSLGPGGRRLGTRWGVSVKSHPSSEPQFPHRQERDDSFSLMWLLGDK